MTLQNPSPLLVSVVLGVTMTIGYGTLYYAYGVLTAGMSADTGLTLTAVYACFSVGLLIGGVASPFIGKALDRVNPGAFMAVGSLMAAALLMAWSLVDGQPAFMVFAVLSIACSALVLYEAAFVLVARACPDTTRRTITGITLIAGFASTIFWPLTDFLSDRMSWRAIYLIYAGLHVAVCAPLHAVLARKAAPLAGRPLDAPAAAPSRAGVLPVDRRRLAFVLMIVAFSTVTFVIGGVHLHLIGMLAALGLGSSTALIGALIGPSQVAGRVIEFASGGRIDIMALSVFATLALPLGLVVLLGGAPALVAGLVFAVVFGLGQGLSFIMRGVLPLHLFGHAGYGALTGKANAVRLTASAAAPFAMAAIVESYGVTAAIVTLVAIGLTGLFALLAIPLLARGDATLPR